MRAPVGFISSKIRKPGQTPQRTQSRKKAQQKHCTYRHLHRRDTDAIPT
jgi:hypothetical protein